MRFPISLPSLFQGAGLAKICAALVVCFASEAFAADTPAERATLRGLHAVRVVVDCGHGEGTLFKSAALAAEISARLKGAQITLLGAQERAQGQPTLCLTLVALSDDSGGERMVSYWRELSLVRETRLARSPTTRIAAPTWRSLGVVGSVPESELGKLHEAILADVDRFIAAYRSANAE